MVATTDYAKLWSPRGFLDCVKDWPGCCVLMYRDSYKANSKAPLPGSLLRATLSPLGSRAGSGGFCACDGEFTKYSS